MTDPAAFDDAGESTDRHRRRERDSLLLIASIAVGGEPAREVRIRNVSAEGLMAEVGHVVEPGTAVALDLRGVGPVTGKVAWCTEGRVGITLDRPIDPKQTRKPVGAGTTTPFYAKPLVSGLR
ncbi:MULTISPECIES: PilZ domain-containing protein [unclassified Sphingomonas]|nr:MULTISPECIES: PilZ domain-containing protein [unclassified Sphingomonas]